MNSIQQQRPDESFRSDLRTAVRFLQRRSWLIMLCVLVAGIAGAAYIVFGPKLYRAEAVIQVEQGDGKSFKMADGTEVQELRGDEISKTIEQSLTSPELLVGLIKNNDLDGDPAFLPGLKRPVSAGKMAGELARHISAQLRRGTRLIDIRVEDQDPVVAQRIAELLVKEFTRQNSTRHMERWEASYEFVLNQAQGLKARLAKSEEALQAYKEQHPGVGLGERENIIAAKLGDLNRMVTEAKVARFKLESDYGQIKKLGNRKPTALLGIPGIANSPAIVESQKIIAQKEAEVAALMQTYKAGHPIYTAATKQLLELKTGLDRLILRAADEVTSAYESAVATEKKMEEALQEQESAALQVSKALILYNVLRQDVESDRTLYESTLNRLKEIQVSKGAVQDAIRLASHPLLPDRPISPDKKRVLLLSIIVGLALGFGLSLLLAALDGSLQTVDEAERQLGVPALSVIPNCARPKWLTDDLLLIKQPGSVTAESFRTLRTSLSLLGRNSGHKVFLFTSAVASEGKSFCAINCAVAFAQQGLETLLVDADLRSPSIGRIFFDGAPLQGLTDALTYEMNLNDVVQLTYIRNLSVLCAGTQLDTPAELLAGEGFGWLIRQAMARFDRVVIDSAPIQTVSDTLLLVGYVQATCLVVSAQTSAEVVAETVRKLGNADPLLVGFILNRASPQHYGAPHGYRNSHVACTRASAADRKRPSKPLPRLEGPA